MSGLNAVKNFRLQEIKSFPKHILRHGPLPQPTQASPVNSVRLPNPFLPKLNPNTGRWAPPRYSLRRQAELIKKAKASNTLHLLPSGPKFQHIKPVGTPKGKSTKPVSQEIWATNVDWVGDVKEKKVPGADIGFRLYAGKKRMFKGHKWERLRNKKAVHKNMMMKDMRTRINIFKKVRPNSLIATIMLTRLQYHRRRMPSPLAVPKVKSSTKLPF